MDLAAAQVIGAGLAAIGVGAAAIGVGNVFGSFLESALRNPAAADGQQGRLFIGFAAAELLGLHRVRRRDDHPLRASNRPEGRQSPRDEECLRSTSFRSSSASQLFWLAVVFGIIFFVIGRGMLPKIQATVELATRRSPTISSARRRARAEAEATEAEWRAAHGRCPRGSRPPRTGGEAGQRPRNRSED